VSNNQFSCAIPDEFCELSSIKLIDLKYNELTGSIPNMFHKLDDLDCFVVQGNSLTGELPKSLGYPAYIDCILTENNCEDESFGNFFTGQIAFQVIRKCDITICNSPPPPSRPSLPPLPPPPPPPEARETPPSPPPPPPESEPPCPPKPDYEYVDEAEYYLNFPSTSKAPAAVRRLAELARSIGIGSGPLAVGAGAVALVAVVALAVYGTALGRKDAAEATFEASTAGQPPKQQHDAAIEVGTPQVAPVVAGARHRRPSKEACEA